MGRDRNSDPVYFVNASRRKGKNSEEYHIWSRTFDLREVEQVLGTSVVSLTVIKPKNKRDETDRLVIINPSEPKYLPKRDDSGPRDSGRRDNRDSDSGQSRRRDDDIID